MPYTETHFLAPQWAFSLCNVSVGLLHSRHLVNKMSAGSKRRHSAGASESFGGWIITRVEI